jgi:hypothetical protein
MPLDAMPPQTAVRAGGPGRRLLHRARSSTLEGMELCPLVAEVAGALAPGPGGLILGEEARERARGAILALPAGERAHIVEHLLAVAARVVAEIGHDDVPAFDDLIELAAVATWEELRGADALAASGKERSAQRLVSTDRPMRAPRPDDPRPTAHRTRIRI